MQEVRETQFWQAEFPLVPPDSPTSEVVSAQKSVPRDIFREGDQASGLSGGDLLNPSSMSLDAMMPLAQETFATRPLYDPPLDLCVSPLHRRILFALSNNYAGLRPDSFRKVLDSLQQGTSMKLYELICSSPCWSAKAIMRNLFKGAIEVRDAAVVRSILRNPAISIDPNQEICFVSTQKYTPIERASALRHREIVEILLQYHVDVNKTYSTTVRQGALVNAIFGVNDGLIHSRVYERFDMNISKMLLNEGGDLPYYYLTELIRKHEDELVIQLLTNLAWKHHKKWSECGLFRDAVNFLHIDTSKQIIKIMLSVGADVNHDGSGKPSRTSLEREFPGRIIDVVAERGDLASVKMLLENKALPTGDTLACAVSSGVTEVVEFLFLNGCSVDDIGILKITPFAAAIQLKSPHLRELVMKWGALTFLHWKEHLTLALRAASTVGDVKLLEDLIHLYIKVTPKDLGHALAIATKEGQNEAVNFLIDVGADLNLASDGTDPPLKEALKHRNEELVISLLDAGANPNQGYSLYAWSLAPNGAGENQTHEELIPAIRLAAEWGNHAVVKRLIFEGVNVRFCEMVDYDGYRNDSILTVPIERGDEQLVKTLLQSGACPNPYMNAEKMRTPLAVATAQGNLKITETLLDYGADPSDSRALQIAASKEISDLILQHHRNVYPCGSKDFGGLLLKDAIFQGNEGQISMLLKQGMDPETLIWDDGWYDELNDESDQDGNQGTSPFGFAISKSQPNRSNIVNLLLPKTNDRNIIVSAVKENHAWQDSVPQVTALLAAVGTNDTSLVKLLVCSGADVKFPAKGTVKRTPLQRAAECGFHKMAESLIHLNANVNAAPAYSGGGTALQLAALGGSLKTVHLLLCHKADVDALASKINGRTALEGAAENGYLDTVKMLLNAGAAQSRGLDRPQFERAMEFARQSGHFDTVELLELHQRQCEQGRLVEGTD